MLVDAINWNLTYTNLIEKIVCSPERKECMIHRCESCPGSTALKEFLDNELNEHDADDEIQYCQWSTTDRATLTTVISTYEEYKEHLISSIHNLTKHSYIAKCQARYLNLKKDRLGKNEGIVLGDFAENYQFLIQNEIQSYHWSKEYCTLHPLVFYFVGEDGKIKHDSFCFISDDNNHDTSFVYQVQTMFIDQLNATQPHITNLFYFSDGCSGQYKNYKNFMNLCSHKRDFDIKAEWIFFATSHGKSSCDGIGGAVKRHTAKRSLQRPLNNQILDYKTMLELCRNEMPSIKFFAISKESMKAVRERLETRYANGNTVPGSRSSHHFLPLTLSKIGHKLTSEDNYFVGRHDFSIPTLYNISEISLSSYVTCVYDSFWWVGMVTDIDIAEGDVKIDFMHPHGPRQTFRWPRQTDSCFVPIKNIIQKISAPCTCTGRTYKFDDNDILTKQSLNFQNFKLPSS